MLKCGEELVGYYVVITYYWSYINNSKNGNTKYMQEISHVKVMITDYVKLNHLMHIYSAE